MSFDNEDTGVPSQLFAKMDKIANDPQLPALIRGLASKITSKSYVTFGSFLKDCSVMDLECMLFGLSREGFIQFGSGQVETPSKTKFIPEEDFAADKDVSKVRLSSSIFSKMWKAAMDMTALMLSTCEGLEWQPKDEKTYEARINILTLFCTISMLSKMNNETAIPRYEKFSLDISVLEKPLQEYFDFSPCKDSGLVSSLMTAYEIVAEAILPGVSKNWGSQVFKNTSVSPSQDRPPMSTDDLGKLWDRLNKG